MATPWTDSVRTSKRLSIHPLASVDKGLWKISFQRSVHNLNLLLKANGIGVTLVVPTGSHDSGTGDDVRVEAADGDISVSYGGTSTSREKFDGARLHGRTLPASVGDKIEKAFVFLSARPQINTPKGRRPAGANIIELIAMHEMVHACGLADSDHSTDDIFQANPAVDYGSSPAADRVLLPGGKSMPPFKLGAQTIAKLKMLWP